MFKFISCNLLLNLLPTLCLSECIKYRSFSNEFEVITPKCPMFTADSGSGGKGKPKQKAYRRSDSSGGRSRSTTKELALPPDDSLMCPPSFLTGLKPDLEVVDGTKMELKVSVKVSY